jgi:DNA-binding GntR family transcriptional regulator
MVELREALEREAISRLVQRVRSSPEEARQDIEQLEKNIELMAGAVKASDIPALINADYNFHGAIIDGSGNSIFTAIYGTLRSFMHEEIRKTLEGVSISDQEVDKHRLIFEAIREGSLERALAAFLAHMEHARARLRSSNADPRG